MEEPRNFAVKITASANATFSHRDGEHDDLVLATALVLWDPKRPRERVALIWSDAGSYRRARRAE